MHKLVPSWLQGIAVDPAGMTNAFYFRKNDDDKNDRMKMNSLPLKSTITIKAYLSGIKTDAGDKMISRDDLIIGQLNISILHSFEQQLW